MAVETSNLEDIAAKCSAGRGAAKPSLDINYCHKCILSCPSLSLNFHFTSSSSHPASPLSLFLLFCLLLHPLQPLFDPRPNFSNLASPRSVTSTTTEVTVTNNRTIPTAILQVTAQSTRDFAKPRKLAIPFLRRLSIPSLTNSAD